MLNPFVFLLSFSTLKTNLQIIMNEKYRERVISNICLNALVLTNPPLKFRYKYLINFKFYIIQSTTTIIIIIQTITRRKKITIATSNYYFSMQLINHQEKIKMYVYKKAKMNLKVHFA
jgi:hypothetical protein